MAEYRLGEVERQFAEIIWEKEPLSSGELVALCTQELEWKKSTTYTVLKRVCERGLFQNEDGTVSSLVSRDEFYGKQSEQFVEETFAGSLPSFVAAFTSQKRLSEKDISELEELIKAHKRGDR